MKKARFLAALGLSVSMIAGISFSASAASASDFKDVSPTAWYYNAVDYAASNGLFSGTGKNTFSPDVGMTRGMFVTVLGRKSGVPDTKPTETSFSDVKPSDWFAPYVEWAADNGIVSGTGNGKFTPNENISRQQMATIFYRYAQKTGNDTSVDPATFNTFSDKGKVTDYAIQGMKWATSHNILKGSGGKLDPTGTATRAQVAQVFLNAKDVLVKTEIVEPTEPDKPEISPRVAEIKALVEEKLPASCVWSEKALNAGWYGAMNGTPEYIAEGCLYWLTELDGIVYDIWYLEEREDGFYLYYG